MSGLFHHHKKQDEDDRPSYETNTYSESAYADGPAGYSESTKVVAETYTNEVDYRKEEEEHKKKEHKGELGAMAAGAFALYEKHEAKKDPEHAHRHKLEEEIAAAAAVGAGGYAFHEKHERKEAKEEDEEAHGKKHHHLF
ncbi:hypothetical protein NAB79_19115 [Proteus mirabilis]|nr:hypothetical protein [Proteus mirabilis]